MAASFSRDAVSLEEHRRWFEARLNDPSARLFVLERDGAPVAQARFDLRGADAEVDITVAPKERGKGYGVAALRLAAAAVLGSERVVNALVADIRPENVASIRCFQKAGFTPAGTVQLRGHTAERFILTRDRFGCSMEDR